MANLRIPEPIQKGFATYFELPEDQRSVLISSLKDVPLGSTFFSLSTFLQQKVDLNSIQSNSLASLIFSFIGIIEELGYTLNDLVNEFNEALIETENEKLSTGKDNLKKLKEILSASMTENLIISKKAIILEYERSNLITDTKILTDIRPIFGGAEEEEVKTLITLFNLRISFKKQDEKDEIERVFFALDINDLKNLKKQITRAEKKALKLKEKYNTIEITKNAND